MRTRHYGVLGVTAQSILMTATPIFCENFDPSQPQTIIQVAALIFTAVIAGADYRKNSGKN